MQLLCDVERFPQPVSRLLPAQHLHNRGQRRAVLEANQDPTEELVPARLLPPTCDRVRVLDPARDRLLDLVQLRVGPCPLGPQEGSFESVEPARHRVGGLGTFGRHVCAHVVVGNNLEILEVGDDGGVGRLEGFPRNRPEEVPAAVDKGGKVFGLGAVGDPVGSEGGEDV